MANILIINAHWNNHGDEAAVRAMVDELKINNKISLQLLSRSVKNYPYNAQEIPLIQEYPRIRYVPDIILGIITKGKLVFTISGKQFFSEISKADFVIHAPGGPSIGEIYKKAEYLYLLRFLALIRLKKPYMFYAPSAGPFKNPLRNILRKYIYKNAVKIIFREELSKQYFDSLLPNNEAIVTLDSAFQHEITKSDYEDTLKKDLELSKFLEDPEKVVGMTITDLKWHPVYGGQKQLSDTITHNVKEIVETLGRQGYRILFIPQLFGEQNDSQYMKSLCEENCFVMDEDYDCYFQQYIISKIHAVIGMRYHSNIFAAKMSTPFISISYEQKMAGFIKKINYEDYYLDISDFNAASVIEKFNNLNHNYADIKEYLASIKEVLTKESHRSTEIVNELLKNE